MRSRQASPSNRRWNGLVSYISSAGWSVYYYNTARDRQKERWQSGGSHGGGKELRLNRRGGREAVGCCEAPRKRTVQWLPRCVCFLMKTEHSKNTKSQALYQATVRVVASLGRNPPCSLCLCPHCLPSTSAHPPSFPSRSPLQCCWLMWDETGPETEALFRSVTLRRWRGKLWPRWI